MITNLFETFIVYFQAGSSLRGHLHVHGEPGEVDRDAGRGVQGGRDREPHLHHHEQLLVHPGGAPGPRGGHSAKVRVRCFRSFEIQFVVVSKVPCSNL